MADYTFQTVTGHWRHLVDDTVRDPDDLPDSITPAGSVLFTPWLGENGQLPTGDPTTLVSVDTVTALIVDGDLADLQGRPGVKLVATIGDNPVWWTATPRLEWKGRKLPGKKITFGPTGTDVNLADLIDVTQLPPDKLPAYKDAAISASQAAASAAASETSAARAETAAAGVADISAQVDQVAGYSSAAVTARDEAVAAKDTAVTAANSAQSVVDNAEQIIRTDLEAEITTATTAATQSATARDAAITAQTAAESARDQASTSASGALASKTAAASSATNAATSETNAVASKTAATNARDAAAGSATDASSSAAAAAGSASDASTSATAAATSKSDAQTARTGAEVARDAAAGSATAAGSSESNAGASASAAAQSATDASNSAGAAAGSASTASSAASGASGDRTLTEAARSGAETAATNAATSASAASSSETNAATSETNAANSATAAAQSAQEAANAVNDGIADATATTKGGIMLPGSADGELGGTYDHPVVTGWASKADLVDGVIPSSQIPAIALVDTYVVASETERLALTCQTGDIAIQTGNPGRGTYILKGTDPAAAADWVPFTVPDSAVTSVNGYTGVVVLGRADVGLGAVDNTSDLAKPVSTAQQTALDGKAPTGRKVAAGTGLTGGGDLTQDRALAADFGTTAGKGAQGNDSRFSDKRQPVDGSVQTISLADDAVTKAKTATDVQTSLGKADSAVQPGAFGSVVVGTLPGTGVSGVLYVVP